jgi:hypothetical protein
LAVTSEAHVEATVIRDTQPQASDEAEGIGVGVSDGAKPGMRGTFEAGDLPGVNLTFGGAAGAAVVPTKGRSLDHIGFEVRNLEQLVKDLEAKGVKFDRPYTKVPALGIAIAFLTDPWGTYIEPTEGLPCAATMI